MIPNKQPEQEKMRRTAALSTPRQAGADYDAAIIGCGPAGLLAALELAAHLRSVLLIGPPDAGRETRTTALMMPSIQFLERHGLWKKLAAEAAPLRVMRILDGTKRLIRSPAVEFHASEIGLDAFGYNIPNKNLNVALAAAVAARPHISRCEIRARNYVLERGKAEIILSNGEKTSAKLIAAADGRGSAARAAAGIDISRWAYPQAALTLIFTHEFPHNSVSTEFHTEEGPFTQVPLIGRCSALVWTMRPEKAQALQALSARALNEKIAARMNFMLGKVEVEALPEAWPMGGMIAKSFAANRVALLGEAAHTFPPIGAQGLNLTLRDAEALGRAVALNPADAGAQMVMQTYNKQRKGDILFRTGIVHSLNRALLANFLPVQLLRSGGLELLRRHSMLRNLFMREGMAPCAGLSRLLPSFLRSKS